MRRKSIYTIGVISLLFVLSSCANQTTDPHQGGLFSYNPAAYESRIQSRQKRLAQQKKENQSMRNKGARLEKEKTSVKREMAALKKKIASLYKSIASLEKKLRKATDGDIEILKPFWKFDHKLADQGIVPPLLVYTDLMATGDARNIETAGIIYDKYLAQLGRQD